VAFIIFPIVLILRPIESFDDVFEGFRMSLQQFCHESNGCQPPFRNQRYLHSEKLVQIYSLSPDCRPIIFANACSTSKIVFNGDKTLGLAAAFVMAAALAFIGTIKPIEDTLASTFVSKFYTNLKL
jgi:hypothetical protein